jgi:hypothetical protein
VCLLIFLFFILQLLELPQFQDIIKIKTIGSTYMAASGLNPSRQVKVRNLYSLCGHLWMFTLWHFQDYCRIWMYECMKTESDVNRNICRNETLTTLRGKIPLARNWNMETWSAQLSFPLLFQPDDPIQVRWSHLALLVEFALELKKALQGINEQSFNHFVLKMGEHQDRPLPHLPISISELHFLRHT